MTDPNMIARLTLAALTEEQLARKLCEIDGWNPDSVERVGIKHVTGSDKGITHGELEPLISEPLWTVYRVKACKLLNWFLSDPEIPARLTLVAIERAKETPGAAFNRRVYLERDSK